MHSYPSDIFREQFEIIRQDLENVKNTDTAKSKGYDSAKKVIVDGGYRDSTFKTV